MPGPDAGRQGGRQRTAGHTPDVTLPGPFLATAHPRRSVGPGRLRSRRCAACPSLPILLPVRHHGTTANGTRRGAELRLFYSPTVDRQQGGVVTATATGTDSVDGDGGGTGSGLLSQHLNV